MYIEVKYILFIKMFFILILVYYSCKPPHCIKENTLNNAVAESEIYYRHCSQLSEEESRHWRSHQSSKPTTNEEERRESASDVPLLSHPGEAGSKLPGDEEAQSSGAQVETDHTLSSCQAEEHCSGQTRDQGYQNHVPRN